jgi:hypothetical protein
VTVKEELTKLPLVITPRLESEPMESPPVRERSVPWALTKERFFRVEVAAESVATKAAAVVVAENRP